jgi:hypothetical protein
MDRQHPGSSRLHRRSLRVVSNSEELAGVLIEVEHHLIARVPVAVDSPRHDDLEGAPFPERHDESRRAGSRRSEACALEQDGD